MASEGDLFGLDQYQEHLRAVNLLVDLNNKVVVWYQQVQDLVNQSPLEYMTFARVDQVIQQIMVHLNSTLSLVQKEKKSFRDQCKKVRESIKAVPDGANFVNPEPPKEATQEVLQEGSVKKKKKRPVKKRKLELPDSHNTKTKEEEEAEDRLKKDQEEAEALLERLLEESHPRST